MAPETMYVLASRRPAGPATGVFHSLKVRLRGQAVLAAGPVGWATRTASSPNCRRAPLPTLQAGQRSHRLGYHRGFACPNSKMEQRPGPRAITMVAHLDIAPLAFRNQAESAHQKLTLVGVLLDARGGVVTGKRSELDLNFTEATFAQLANRRACLIDDPSASRSYSVRALVEDALEGKLTAAGGAVEIK